ncbi:hypothetical protein [Caulobacter sp. X]|uniref:hypothetical protein n=1 Tax=Caulobacter sp. X TaxID=2048901 RepID=UPI001178BCCB|nr:hypothetical protein [Caulobacter sp. X]
MTIRLSSETHLGRYIVHAMRAGEACEVRSTDVWADASIAYAELANDKTITLAGVTDRLVEEPVTIDFLTGYPNRLIYGFIRELGWYTRQRTTNRGRRVIAERMDDTPEWRIAQIAFAEHRTITPATAAQAAYASQLPRCY